MSKNKKPIDIQEYRKYVLDKYTFEKNLPGVWVRYNPEKWKAIKKVVSPSMEYTDYRGPIHGVWRPWKWGPAEGNHPLVEDKIA